MQHRSARPGCGCRASGSPLCEVPPRAVPTVGSRSAKQRRTRLRPPRTRCLHPRGIPDPPGSHHGHRTARRPPRRSRPAWSVMVSSSQVRARSVGWPRSEWPKRVPATDPRRQAAQFAPASLLPNQGVKVGKNVAVFVDVANIFYAAKAAGTDIDYVTLLKAATAGRDFVRAYAYTGLDPENENQRNFHAFLARNHYKVVSKDIRKYGDGKVKANLDIELVVDLMKTARNLDIAIVVSGDGDFAPAIRAVQEMGVRVEVISFRGNTSSDLIDVADLFTDITQLARVDKSSSRSGRRVAGDEEDLSMTEVPDKQTEGSGTRARGRGRGRGRAGEAEPVAASAASG